MNDRIQIPAAVDINDLLLEEEEDYNWIIPGLLEEGDRLILTGNEGKGKSTLQRQVAVQLAQGIHPFTYEPIEPKRVMIFDLENSRRQVKRKLREMDFVNGVKRGMLNITCLPGGLDLSTHDIQMAFTDSLSNFYPDLLIMGPMYKMGGQLEKEEDSGKLAAYLDSLRSYFGFALVMESHQPHQVVTQQMKYRPERPYGSSLWMRWPEFGLCLEDDGTLRHWRGARDVRDWPVKLRWGDEWPWVVDSRKCLVCAKELTDLQEKYCSTTCGSNARSKALRARSRLL